MRKLALAFSIVSATIVAAPLQFSLPIIGGTVQNAGYDYGHPRHATGTLLEGVSESWNTAGGSLFALAFDDILFPFDGTTTHLGALSSARIFDYGTGPINSVGIPSPLEYTAQVALDLSFVA